MNLDRTVEFLASLRLEGRRAEALPEHLVPPDLAAGYQAQERLVDRLCVRWGGRRVGYKVALTNPAAQRMLGVPHPVFGQLISARVHRSGATLAARDYVVRLIECEIGVRMAADAGPDAGTWSRDTIADRVGEVIPSVELVEHHFADIDRVTPESLAADNAIHGAWIHGDAAPGWRDIDLAAQPTRLMVNGVETLVGSGGNVLGHPLEVVAWLANELPRHGRRLRAGDFVTTGVTTDEIYPAEAGDRLLADFPGLGTVEFGFE